LALVKKYCEINGAEISVERIKGKGTTFRVIFPDNII
jgi:signal transduction histidine kinase